MEIAGEIINLGRSLSTALSETVLLGQDIIEITQRQDLTFSDLSEAQRAEILRRLQNLGPTLETVEVDVENLKLADKNLGLRRDLFFWQPVIKPLQEKLPEILKNFEYLITASKTLPELLGYDDEKVYLFLLQNNNELRPSGGFIGTYGVLKVRNADIVSFKTDNIYNLDSTMINKLKIEPPYPIKKYLVVPNWFMRDANWWPDYPTSALKVEEFYHLEKGSEDFFDGIIAINPDLIEDLLGLTGPIQVADLTFTKDNFTQQLQYQVEFGYYKRGIPEKERKEIIGEMSKKLEQKLLSLPLDKLDDLFKVVSDSLDRKHVLGYFYDQKLQAFFENKKWAGQVELTEEDYFQLVDANLAALQTDAVMEKSVTYQLRPEAENLVVNVEINYQHNGWFDDFTTRYRSYTRIYVPEGSELIFTKIGDKNLDISKEVDVYHEFGKTAFGVFFEVEPRQAKSLVFQYKLPQEILDLAKDGDYKLLVQKQPGLKQFDLSLDLSFPKDMKVFGNSQKANQVEFSGTIEKDEWYTVLFE
jgi:hypothetical protein